MFRSLARLGIVLALTTAPALADSVSDFGEPPSGSIPILFNDHHVYAKPDRLRANRVLAALIHGNQVLVPLRSMFEQMGGTVSYDGSARTIVVAAGRASISLTLDQPSAVINGQSRPLDVPPMIVDGIVMVPVRVIAETLGAYVLWDAGRRVVIVRYINNGSVPAPPGTLVTPVPLAPGPAPAGPETPIPTPLLQAPSMPNRNEHFIAFDYLFASKVANELDPGNAGHGSYALRGALEFSLLGLPAMIGGDYRTFQYPHESTIPSSWLMGGANPCPHFGGTPPFPATDNPGCVTTVGDHNQMPIGDFTARDSQFDAKLGVKVFDPRMYIGASYITLMHDYGGFYDYPTFSGFGFGLDKLPDLQNHASLYGGIWYYPRLSNDFHFPATGVAAPLAGTTEKLEQQMWQYQVGGTIDIGHTGLFIDGGFLGDSTRGNFRPSDATHSGAYVGLGLHF